MRGPVPTLGAGRREALEVPMISGVNVNNNNQGQLEQNERNGHSTWTFRRSLRQGLWLIPWEIGSLGWLLGILEKQSGAAGGFGLGY